ncbi:MAG: DNA polymerase III subunit alpha, partial [bacterium]|nr:DNA polymerase III subunit alpha [bacterium]
PMELIPDNINSKQNRKKVEYLHPLLEPILKETYGVMVYQEQVMKIASTLANFSLGDADILRRAMGKKDLDVMAEQKDRFLKGCHANNIPVKKAEKIFELMAKFASYGFNKSHSAAYALISYQTAYLKAHYPVEYLAAFLTHEMGNTDKVMLTIADAREHGIEVLPPDINESFSDFSVVGPDKIRFGLAAIKNVGAAAVESMIECRKEEERFRSLHHFLESIDGRKINKRAVESMIKCGCFDQVSPSRAACLEGLASVLEMAAKKQRARAQGQASLFGSSNGTALEEKLPDIPDWPMKKKLAFEKESLGFYITGHPLKEYEHLLDQRGLVHSDQLKEMRADGKGIRIGGIVSALREITTKSGNRMAFVTLEDLKGFVQVIVFAELYKKVMPLLKSDQPILTLGDLDLGEGEEEIKILARDIAPLVRQTVGHEVHVRLASARIRKEQLEDLKKLIQSHRGKIPLVLHLQDPSAGETILSLPQELGVEPSPDLLKSVNSLFGGEVTSLS